MDFLEKAKNMLQMYIKNDGKEMKESASEEEFDYQKTQDYQFLMETKKKVMDKIAEVLEYYGYSLETMERIQEEVDFGITDVIKVGKNDISKKMNIYFSSQI